MSETPPPVLHALNCQCTPCRDARRDEAAARLEESSREENRGRELAFLESLGGPVYARLGLPKPMPGTRRAIVARYGRVGS